MEFSRYRSMLSANRDTFTFCLSIWMLSISFSCLIDLARTSNIVLNRSGERGHPCLDFKGECFQLLPISIMLAVGLSLMALIIESFYLMALIIES